MTQTDCPFCPPDAERVAFAQDEVIGLWDGFPVSPGHLLVIPKRHFASLNETTDAALLGHLMLAAREIAEGEGLAQSGYRLVVNTGAEAGQTVAHVHLHLLGGRRMKWPPG